VEADAGGVGDGAVVGQGSRIEAHRVGQVVRVGAKAQSMPLSEAESFVHAHIDAEEALTAEIVAGSRLPGKRQAEKAAGISGAEIESEGLTVDEGQFLARRGTVQHRLPFGLEVGVEGGAGVDAERKSAGPAIDAAELPATKDGIGETVPGV